MHWTDIRAQVAFVILNRALYIGCGIVLGLYWNGCNAIEITRPFW